MPTVELAERSDLKTAQTLEVPQATASGPNPVMPDHHPREAFAVPQALSLTHLVAAPQDDPFDVYSGAQPSDRGYDNYWLDPKSPSF